jgi:hypothetical protein
MDAPNTARCHPPPRTRPVSTIFFLTVGYPRPARCGSFLSSPESLAFRRRPHSPPPHPSPARLRPRRARSFRSRPFAAVLEPPPTRAPGLLLPRYSAPADLSTAAALSTPSPQFPCSDRGRTRGSSPPASASSRTAAHLLNPNHYPSPLPPVSFLPIHIARCTTAGCAGSFRTQLRPLRRRRQSRRCHLTQATLISALRSCISSAAVKEVCGLLGLSGGFWSVGGPVRPCLGRKRLGGRRAW